MALIKCKECGNEVSTKADKCPNCGAPVKPKQIGCFASLIIIFLVIGLIGIISSNIYKSSERKANRKARAHHSQKEQKEREVFLASIDEHYQKVVSLYKSNKLEEAAIEASSFKKHNKLDYKDIDSLQQKIKIGSLEQKLKGIPFSSAKQNLDIYKQLLQLAPANTRYKNKVAYYANKYDEQQRWASSDLELLNWHWGNEYGYVTAEGQVKNISGRRLENVMAVVTWKDSNGNMITSDSALIEYRPLMPGQTSPFKVMESYNPLMKKASIGFKHLMGEEIRYIKR